MESWWMIVASIWAEGLHGGPCQPAAAVPTLNVAVAGEKGTWTEPLRSIMMQTQVQPGRNALRRNKTPKVHAPATSGLQP